MKTGILFYPTDATASILLIKNINMNYNIRNFSMMYSSSIYRNMRRIYRNTRYKF